MDWVTNPHLPMSIIILYYRASNWAVSSYSGWRDIGEDWVTNRRPGGYLCVITGACRKKLRKLILFSILESYLGPNYNLSC